jgi:hypothetical protein
VKLLGVFLFDYSNFAISPPYGDVIHFNHVTLCTLCENFRVLSLGELYGFAFRFGQDHDAGGYSEKVGRFFVSGIDAEEFIHPLLYEAHREFYTKLGNEFLLTSIDVNFSHR